MALKANCKWRLALKLIPPSGWFAKDHKLTSSELASDDRFGALSRRAMPEFRISGRQRLLSSGKRTSRRDLPNVCSSPGPDMDRTEQASPLSVEPRRNWLSMGIFLKTLAKIDTRVRGLRNARDREAIICFLFRSEFAGAQK